MIGRAVRSGFLVTASALALATPALAQEAAEASTQVDELVVTASKREERLRDVPVAITAVTGETIEDIGVDSFRDYASLVPGLSQRDFGAPGTGAIILRGLNTGPQQTTNTAAYYIDETPFNANGFLSFAASLTPEPDLADVDRIEVLKGPQGTLYGANSLGGLIRVITTKPDATSFSGNARIEAVTIDGGGQGYSVRGAVNIPLIPDVLAVRAVAHHREAAGFTDNVGTGVENVNTADYTGVRLAVRATPTADLTIDISGLYQKIDARGFAIQDNFTDTLTPRFGRNQYRQFADLPTKITYQILNGTVDYDLGFGSLIGTASYARYDSDLSNDITENFIPFLSSIIPVVPPDATAPLQQSPSLKKFTTEGRFASERRGPMEFVAGVFFTDEKAITSTVIPLSTAAGEPLPAPFNLLISNTIHSNYQELAGFGDVTFYFNDRLDVTGGLRYAHNEQDALAPAPGAISFFAPVPPAEFDFSDNATTYLATLRWRPTDQISTYLRAASGYRPGGPQARVAPPGVPTFIEPDTVWNYEAGVKGSFLNGALTANFAVYHIDWENIQLSAISGGTVIEANGGAAKVDGFELEVQTQPSDRLTIAGTVGYTDARLSEIDPGASAVIGAVEGDQLPLTPRWTAALIAEHKIPLRGELEGVLGGTLRHQSGMPSSFPGSLNSNIDLPSFTTVDLRAGINFSRYQLRFRIENVFDEIGYTSSGTNRIFPGQVVPSVATVIQPRTFVVSLRADF